MHGGPPKIGPEVILGIRTKSEPAWLDVMPEFGHLWGSDPTGQCRTLAIDKLLRLDLPPMDDSSSREDYEFTSEEPAQDIDTIRIIKTAATGFKELNNEWEKPRGYPRRYFPIQVYDLPT
ncbi:hypothetical protein C8F01DRAFT_1091926 [Mycena amicta]|nr:hypothetical protein C8F01DRAFT_1091926 [Mycena amicta]